mgnify:FL=1
MKVVILAGGKGTRLSEETTIRPKPMVEIGEKPILWHIMKIYSYFGFNEFIICLGYKGYFIKEYFSNYFLHSNDVTFDFKKKELVEYHNKTNEDWKVTLINTGEESNTGGRLLRVKKYVGEGDFFFTYGDGLSDVNLIELKKFHKLKNKLATVTAVKPPGRFGSMSIENNNVRFFEEKVAGDGGWINGGFFVLNSEIFKFIKNDQTIFEEEVLTKLSQGNNLNAFLHGGFWRPMDTLRDKTFLQEKWDNNQAEWGWWRNKG